MRCPARPAPLDIVVIERVVSLMCLQLTPDRLPVAPKRLIGFDKARIQVRKQSLFRSMKEKDCPAAEKRFDIPSGIRWNAKLIALDNPSFAASPFKKRL